MVTLMSCVQQIVYTSLSISLAYLIGARFAQPITSGCVFTGSLLGSHCFNFLPDTFLLDICSRICIFLILFHAGIDLDIKRFFRVGHASIFVLACQLSASLYACISLGRWLHLTPQTICLWAFVCALNSTVVAVRIMQSSNEVSRVCSTYILGVLLAQDIALSCMAMFLKSADISSELVYRDIFLEVLTTLAPLVVVFLFDVFFLRVRCKIFSRIFHLALMLSCCACGVLLFDRFELSEEYGAFLSGLIAGVVWDREATVETITPVTELFGFVFFFWMGLNLNLAFVVTHIRLILAMLMSLFFAKTAVNGLAIYRASHNRYAGIYGGLLLSTMSELSFSLIWNSDVSLFHIELLTAVVVLSIFFSAVIFQTAVTLLRFCRVI